MESFAPHPQVAFPIQDNPDTGPMKNNPVRKRKCLTRIIHRNQIQKGVRYDDTVLSIIIDIPDRTVRPADQARQGG